MRAGLLKSSNQESANDVCADVLGNEVVAEGGDSRRARDAYPICIVCERRIVDLDRRAGAGGLNAISNVLTCSCAVELYGYGTANGRVDSNSKSVLVGLHIRKHDVCGA